jgi:sortase A
LFLSRVNQREDRAARENAAAVLPNLVQQIGESTGETVPAAETIPGLELQKPVELLTEEDKKMSEVEIDGIAYIGYLSIPSLGLELPIINNWSYSRLNVAPCRYTGSIRGEDLVLMAHNYANHFGKLSQLSPGDIVTFTDMDGNITRYRVVLLDVLHPTAVEEMTSGEFDLTLFTCTYGGKSRVTVCCDKMVWTEQNQ